MIALLGPLLSFFGGKGGFSIAFVAGALAIGGWTAWWFEDEAHNKLIAESAARIERAYNNVRTAREALDAANKTIADMKDQYAKDAIERAKLEWEYASLQKRADEAEAKLDGYRSRWANAATKKPGLVAGLANRATDRRVRRLEAATCRADCDETGNSSGGAGTSTEAGPDSSR